MALDKRRAYQDWDYWGQPVPNFGDNRARLLIVGLAPAAHGANRTGRMFTGDRSGEWLFRALERAGFANQAQAEHAADGLELSDCAITAACHCAPPGNKPNSEELKQCSHWLLETIDTLDVCVFLALGQIGWKALFDALRFTKRFTGSRPKFGHGATIPLHSEKKSPEKKSPGWKSSDQWVLGCYHPSQQNTFTGRLTEPMLDEIFHQARELLK